MKKMSKKIISVACAALMAAQFTAVTASADGTHYYYYNGYYFEKLNDAIAYAGAGNQYKVESVSAALVNTSNMNKKYYVTSENSIVSTEADAQSRGEGLPLEHEVYQGAYVSTTSGTYYSGTWYSTYTGKYYSNYNDALSASCGVSSYVIQTNNYYNSYYYNHWYSSYTGKWYSTYADAVAASNGNSSYVRSYSNYYYNDYYYNTSNGSIYKYLYNGVTYGTLADAQRAGGTSLGVDIFYLPVGGSGDVKYYYYYNGTYYGSLDAAVAAGGTAVGTDISYVPYNYYNNAYYNYGYNYNGYYGSYYNGYYNGYYYGTDPYYVYSQILNNNKKDEKEEEAQAGEPYIYGRKTKAGWDTILKYVKAAKSGNSITVDMNGSYIIDEDILDALDGKNVSMTFVLDNGVKWTINGKNISEAKDLVIYTEYNINYIPKSLESKACKGAVAKAQIGVTDSFDSIGGKATVTVKFSSKRSGCTAVVYRYDPDTDSLKGVSKTKVKSNGNCSFTVKDGGPYLVVLK